MPGGVTTIVRQVFLLQIEVDANSIDVPFVYENMRLKHQMPTSFGGIFFKKNGLGVGLGQKPKTAFSPNTGHLGERDCIPKQQARFIPQDRLKSG